MRNLLLVLFAGFCLSGCAWYVPYTRFNDSIQKVFEACTANGGDAYAPEVVMDNVIEFKCRWTK
jgi:hypothetical protein